MSISDFIMGIEDYEDVQRWKKMAKYFRSGDAAALSILFMNEICPDQEEGRNCDLCGREAKDLCDLISRVQAAAEMAEGKIGPDARPKCDHAWQAAIEERGYQTCLKCGECRNIEDIPRTAPAWQITEERKAAIKELSELLTAIGCPSCHYYIQKNYGENITVLRAMLTEAEQE